jgi:hypothetical protein
MKHGQFVSSHSSYTIDLSGVVHPATLKRAINLQTHQNMLLYVSELTTISIGPKS